MSAEQELIGIREAARRLGLSDTAIHKGIKAGRAFIAARHPTNGRPLVAWPQVRDDWQANSNEQKRTHVGGTGQSERRNRYAAEPAEVVLSVPANAPAPDGDEDGEGLLSYAEARAKRENYQAELARIEFEKESGKLIDAVEVERRGRKLAAAVIAGLYTVPDRISDELAGMSDANEIQALIIAELDRCVSELRRAYDVAE